MVLTLNADIPRKRSTLNEEISLKSRNKKVSPAVNHNVHSSEDSIMQFIWEEHAHRFRRQIRSPDSCTSADDTQHVLFVLDSSGSIGAPSYTRMKEAVSKLTPLFCKKVKFALMTFSSDLILEFCLTVLKMTSMEEKKQLMPLKQQGTKEG